MTTAAVGLTAGGADATVATATSASIPATPKLTASISKKGLDLSGPHTFRAGRLALSLRGAGAAGSVEVASFKKGYTFADLRADVTAFGKSEGENGPSAAGLKHLDTAVALTNLDGGIYADEGQTVSGTVLLPAAGTYYVFNDTDAPTQATKLTVTGPEVVRARPGATATVTATPAERFGGATTLPATGTITFDNTSTGSPHMLTLQHVEAGTTRAQVLAAVRSSTAAPAFTLRGDVNTDLLGQGHSMTLSYRLPKGEYVELCFFPDLKTGVPHAVMGMVDIVHLQ